VPSSDILEQVDEVMSGQYCLQKSEQFRVLFLDKKILIANEVQQKASTITHIFTRPKLPNAPLSWGQQR
jgi:DNA repair protein RadC